MEESLGARAEFISTLTRHRSVQNQFSLTSNKVTFTSELRTFGE